MNKKIITIAIVVLIVLVIAAIFWQLFGAEKKTAEENEEQEAVTGINESQEAENETEINETEINESELIEPIPDDSVPNPVENIRGIDLGNDANGGYYCDSNKTNPKHQAKLYTYRIVGGIKTLSDDYIESTKISNVCKQYPEITGGLRYNMRWQWTSVENVDGYRVYQYYDADTANVTIRNYDYYVELSKISTQLIDTGTNLWTWEKPETITTITNSTNSSS